MSWKDILGKYSHSNQYPKGEERAELKKTEVILEMFEGKLIEKGQAIRVFCLDCAGGSAGEVHLCHSFSCPLYPYRYGTNTRRRAAKAGVAPVSFEGGNKYHSPPDNGSLAWETSPRVDPSYKYDEEGTA